MLACTLLTRISKTYMPCFLKHPSFGWLKTTKMTEPTYIQLPKHTSLLLLFFLPEKQYLILGLALKGIQNKLIVFAAKNSLCAANFSKIYKICYLQTFFKFVIKKIKLIFTIIIKIILFTFISCHKSNIFRSLIFLRYSQI